VRALFKVAEPVWLGLGIALVVLAAYSVAVIQGGVHEPLMVETFAVGLGILGLAALATGRWLSSWPKAVAIIVSTALGGSVVAALYFYTLYMGTSLGGPQ
jgi:hypothetical protein